MPYLVSRSRGDFECAKELFPTRTLSDHLSPDTPSGDACDSVADANSAADTNSHSGLPGTPSGDACDSVADANSAADTDSQSGDTCDPVADANSAADTDSRSGFEA